MEAGGRVVVAGGRGSGSQGGGGKDGSAEGALFCNYTKNSECLTICICKQRERMCTPNCKCSFSKCRNREGVPAKRVFCDCIFHHCKDGGIRKCIAGGILCVEAKCSYFNITCENRVHKEEEQPKGKEEEQPKGEIKTLDLFH